MTSEFVRSVHLLTARHMLRQGADAETLAAHFVRVGFSEWEIPALMALLQQLPGQANVGANGANTNPVDAEF